MYDTSTCTGLMQAANDGTRFQQGKQICGDDAGHEKGEEMQHTFAESCWVSLDPSRASSGRPAKYKGYQGCQDKSFTCEYQTAVTTQGIYVKLYSKAA